MLKGEQKMRSERKVTIAILIVTLVMSFMFCTTAQTADLVIASVEYVDAKIAEVKALIGTGTGTTTPVVDDARITELQTALGNALNEIDALTTRVDFLDNTVREVSDSTIYQVLHLYAGDIVYALGTSEVILRTGSATVIGNTSNEGLSDSTTGENLAPDASLTKDHLVIIPRGDGRGLKITGECYLMYRGSYSYIAANGN
jgi:hypothetical protein